MSHPQHHFSLEVFMRKRKTKHAVNSLAYFVGVTGNIAVVPQIIKAWQSNAPGLAILTWLLFIVIGFIWLIYAFQHKQKPLIVAQIVGITVNVAVVTGWLYNNWIK